MLKVGTGTRREMSLTWFMTNCEGEVGLGIREALTGAAGASIREQDCGVSGSGFLRDLCLNAGCLARGRCENAGILVRVNGGGSAAAVGEGVTIVVGIF